MEFLWTPLHYSANYDHLGIVEYLINNGADLNAKDIYVTISEI